MNRGAGRRNVFFTSADGRRFLQLVGEGVAASHTEVHAYCLMDNHFHLLVRCPSGGLSELMHRIGSMYTRYLNRRLGTDGPLFRSRFRSLLIDSEAYLWCVARYIHRNPLDRRPAVDLDRYPWSSYGAYVGTSPALDWLQTDQLLGVVGGRRAMRQVVEDEPGGLPPLEWMIDLALAEADFDGLTEVTCAADRRSVAISMLDRTTDVELAAAVERWLAFPSGDARRMARARARRRLDAEPRLADVVDRALRLAS